MTKQEAKDTGTNRGVAFANLTTEDNLRLGLDAYRDVIKNAGRDYAISEGFRTVDSANAVAFIEAFIHAANTRFLGRRNDLPDVKAERQIEYVDRELKNGLDYAKRILDKFRANFDENPCYAFEWGTDAIVAAAKFDVYTRLLAVFAEHDIATTIQEAKEAVLRGARYDVMPKSTSPASNLVSAAKVAAFAEFVSNVAGVEKW